MKDGTKYGTLLEDAYAKLRKKVGVAEVDDPETPLVHLGRAMFAVGASEDEARAAVDRVLENMVDWNEVRTSTPSEVLAASGYAGDDGLSRCRRLVDALQCIYDLENRVCLDHLVMMPRREARHYLEQLDGVDEYVVASVVLWGLGGHAIPVDDRLLAALRGAGLIHPKATRAEVQSFLEHHVGAAEAKEFCIIMRSLPEMIGSARRKTRTTAPKTAKAGKGKKTTRKKGTGVKKSASKAKKKTTTRTVRKSG